MSVCPSASFCLLLISACQSSDGTFFRASSRLERTLFWSPSITAFVSPSSRRLLTYSPSCIACSHFLWIHIYNEVCDTPLGLKTRGFSSFTGMSYTEPAERIASRWEVPCLQLRGGSQIPHDTFVECCKPQLHLYAR